MKIRATEEQGYYMLNGMAITTGKVYDVIQFHGEFVVVKGDNGDNLYICLNECVLEEE